MKPRIRVLSSATKPANWCYANGSVEWVLFAGLHPGISRMFSWVYHFCCADLIYLQAKPGNSAIGGLRIQVTQAQVLCQQAFERRDQTSLSWKFVESDHLSDPPEEYGCYCRFRIWCEMSTERGLAATTSHSNRYRLHERSSRISWN